MKFSRLLACCLLLAALPALAQEKPAPAPAASTIIDLARTTNSRQKQDADYSAKIRANTTDPMFLTELVDHLPASMTIPTPQKTLGYIAGEAGHLTYTAEVNRYMRELGKTTRRVQVFSIGTSEEGREMIVVAVSDEGNLKRLDRYKEITARLGDPRHNGDQEAEKLIHEGKALYYLTGAMHSPETGSPEMLMELAYRLAVEETPFVQAIRKNVIVLMTPVLETDGRDRVLDVINNRKKIPGLSPVYWGKYVAHDNNRDGMSLSLALTRNVMKTFLDYHPTVLHDLHESVPFLYTSTGSGPYNPWLDPIVINEWHQMSYHEINEMTKRGVPGVWTHGYYDGWAPNYMFFLANGHNSIGRFYETFGNSNPDTQDRTIGPQSGRDWYRPNPPLNRVKWSLRNNVNYQESALLFALNYTAEHKEELLHNFYLKSKRSIAKATTEGPAAYVLPADERRPGQQGELIHLLRLHGIEASRANTDLAVDDGAFPANSYVIRMDQPYSRMADMLLDTCYYNINDPAPYDDTGWTLGPLKNVRVVRVTDPKILKASMTLLEADPKPRRIEKPAMLTEKLSGGPFSVHLIAPNTADALLMTWRMRLKDVPMVALEHEWQIEGHTFPAGSLAIKQQPLSAEARDRIEKVSQELGITLYPVLALPGPDNHPVSAPRIALLHTWTSTQNEGWFRIGFDQWQIPYDYISVHTIRDTADLRAKYDAIVFGSGAASGQALLNGLSGTQPIPWKKTPETPNLGGPDSSDDIRGGIGQAGMEHLKQFVEQGGLFITAMGTTAVAMDFGMAKGVTTTRAADLQARGGVYNTYRTDPSSPILYGYDRQLAVYFSSGPLFKMEGEKDPAPIQAAENSERSAGQRRGGGGSSERPSGRGGLNDPDIVQARPAPPQRAASKREPEYPPLMPPPASGPRVLLRFADEKNLLVSGMLSGGAALANRAALIDSPYGKGHVLLFAVNPMWRSETQGSYPLLFNAALHFDHLDAGR